VSDADLEEVVVILPVDAQSALGDEPDRVTPGGGGSGIMVFAPWQTRTTGRSVHRPADGNASRFYTRAMRTVFLFPTAERTEILATLDRRFPAQRHPWRMEVGILIDTDDEGTGNLFSDWEPEEVADVDAALGYHPTWALQLDITGRIDGTDEVRGLAALLLDHGGVAYDDYSSHAWTLQEIEDGFVVDGLRFFDFRTAYERYRGTSSS